MKKFAISGLLAAIVGWFAPAPASAALLSCPASFTTDGPDAKVYYPTNQTAASNCQYVDPPDSSNVASVSNINTAGFFGFTDWAANGGNVQVDGGGGATGSWAISGVNFATFDYMIVFKDGSDTNLIGFLLNEEVSSGLWRSPFTNPPFTGVGEAKQVSHYTIVQRSNPTPGPQPGTVPEPAALLLLGAGLLGLGARVRGRRRAAN